MANLIACKRPLQVDHAHLYDILLSKLTDFVVFLMDPEGCIASWNPGVERVLGYSEAEWLGQSATIIFTPEDRAHGKPQEELSAAAAGGQAPDIRWHVRRDGSRLFVEGTMVALRDEAGQLLGFSKVMRDITERKLREVQLQDALIFADSIVQTVREPLLVLDEDLRVRSANRSFYRMFGVEKGETESRRLYELGNGQWEIPAFRKLLEEILPNQTSIEDFEVEHEFQGLGQKVLLLSARKLWREDKHTELTLLAIEDVTDRKRAEREIRESEERWRGLFEGMAEGFFIGELLYDSSGQASDFRFLEVNGAFERLTGLGGAAGKTLREWLPSIEDELIETYAQVVRTSERTQFEIFVPALQNQWFEARTRRQAPGRFAVLFLNITERKDKEGRLRESERQQAALVTLGDRIRDLRGVGPITFAAMEIAGTTLDVARAGYGKVDGTQESVTIENDWTNGGTRSLAGTYRFKDFGEELGERLQRGEFVAISDVSTDAITARESKRWRDLDIRAVINLPLLENGRLAAVLFIQDSSVRDWTEAELAFIRKVGDRTWAAAERARALQELQESEEFTRSVLASSPDCIIVMDLHGRLVAMNDGGCRQFEIEDLAPYLGQPWGDFWDEARGMAEEAISKARQGDITRFESFCPTAKGTPRWWEVVVTPIHDVAGKPLRILALSRDISDRQRAEQERERLTRELRRSNEDLSQFAHIVAHDLQSPLRGVTTFAQLLERRAQERLTADDAKLVLHIVESAYRMQELIQALLRFAHVGQGEIEKKAVAMDLVLDAALQSLQVQIEERGATIAHGVLPLVTGDFVQLLQLIQNLVSNALKYGRPGEAPEVRITADTHRAQILFAVKDNGEGIAPEHQSKIFEPLQRLHGADVPGTGLGLAMCQRIVERHGGRIWVESTLGVGSTFYFTLPSAA